MDNLYIFPNPGIEFRLEEQKPLAIVTMPGGQSVAINFDALRDGSSTAVLWDRRRGELTTLYNFREILQILNLTPSEFFPAFGISGVLQVDKCGGATFVKAFGTVTSSDPEIAAARHETMDGVHPLDWRYSWTCREAAARLTPGGKIHLTLLLWQSDFWQRPVCASHGGQTQALTPGRNEIEFVFVPGENVYLGEPNCRYRARALEVRRLLGEGPA